MRYGILGSTMVAGAPLGPRQVRTVLAVLLGSANRPVSTATLAGELWPDGVPGSAASVLQGRVAILRRLLCPDVPARSARQVIHTRHGCYTLRLADHELDAAEFVRLTEQGRRTPDLREAKALLGAGLALWRGSALQDTGRGPVLSGLAARLAEQRLAALERKFQVDIALGDLTEAIDGLTEVLNRDLAQENFAVLLAEALAAAGRTAAARTVLAETRQALMTLGITPGPALDLDGRVTAGPVVRPAELPPRLPDFVGRVELLDGVRAAMTCGPRLAVLTGPGGIGKSVLAVHAAHQLRGEFPDGQVMAEPGDPAEVLRCFLLSLGVAESSVPPGLVERRHLWRSRTADAKVLVLLDGACSEAEVRALLPGGAECGMIVTSRRRMLGLSGAAHLAVGEFTDLEARRLLSAVTGPARISAEPGPVRRLLARCAGFPLAVRIAGVQLAARPHETVAELVDIDLRAGDLDAHAVLNSSYIECDSRARRTLRLFGELGLSSMSRPAVAEMLDVPYESARNAAEALVEAQLLRAHKVGGEVFYELNNLVASFARQRVDEDVSAAVGRVLDWYLDEARSTTVDSAAWSAAEAENIVAVVSAGLRHGHLASAWLLADLFAQIIEVRPAARGARAVTVLAICAARRSGDARAEAISMRRLGELHWQQAKAAISLRYLTSAASRFSALGDDVELARTLIVQADIFADTGRAREARDRLSDALALAARAGDSLVQAAALDQLGSALSDAGEFAAAQRCFKEALQLSRSDDRIAIRALKRRADVLRRGGRYDQSAVLLREALTAARRSGDIHWEAHVLRSLGEAQRYVGDTREARRSLVRSLELFNENGHRHAVAYSLRSLADLHAQLREYEQAAEALETCRTMFEDLADRRGQAYTLRSLGGLCVRTGRLPQAEQALRAALSIFDDLSLRWFSQDAARALARTRNQRLLQKT